MQFGRGCLIKSIGRRLWRRSRPRNRTPFLCGPDTYPSLASRISSSAGSPSVAPQLSSIRTCQSKIKTPKGSRPLFCRGALVQEPGLPCNLEYMANSIRRPLFVMRGALYTPTGPPVEEWPVDESVGFCGGIYSTQPVSVWNRDVALFGHRRARCAVWLICS